MDLKDYVACNAYKRKIRSLALVVSVECLRTNWMVTKSLNARVVAAKVAHQETE